MAHIRHSINGISDGDASSIIITLPENYANDLLVIFVTQDNGSTVFSIDNSNWTELYQDNNAGIRFGCYYLLTSSGGEANPTITGYDSADWSFTVMTIEGADVDNPIDNSTNADWNNTNKPQAPNLTINNDKSLVLYCIASDNSKFVYGDMNKSRYVGKARSLGCCQATFMRWAETTNDYVVTTGRHELSTEGGKFFVLSIKDGSNGDLCEYNVNTFCNFVKLWGYEKMSNNAVSDFTTDKILGFPTDTNTYSLVVTKTTVSDYGYTSKLEINNTDQTSDLWSGNTDVLTSAVDLTVNGSAGVLSLQFHVASTYFKKVGEKGLIFGIKDGNSNYQIFNIPIIMIEGNILYRLIIDLSKNLYDQVSGTVDFTNITHFMIASHRSPTASQNMYVYAKKIFLLNGNLELQGGSPTTPITSLTINTDISGWQLTDLVKNVAGTLISKIPYTVDANSSIVLDKEFLDIPRVNSLYRIDYGSAKLIFNAGIETVLNQSLINTVNYTPLQILYTDDNYTVPNLVGSTIINFDLLLSSTASTVTYNNIVVAKSKVSMDNVVLNKCLFDNSKVYAGALDNITNSSFILGDNNFDYGIEVPGTGTFDFTGNTIAGYDDTNKLIHFTATSGDIVINIKNSDTPTYKSEGASVSIVNNINFKFTLKPSITDYEWRLYSVTAAGSLDGSINLAGEESATQDNQTYTYNYTNDIIVCVQILPFADDYVESDTYYTLGETDQNVTINLVKDINN